ncbi:MAG: SAM-dependent methyltransferase [Deltaproteobacteria bacterium]|nr:SAM-dependent methyltransferase [Deltaproteobacteria bacterium]
MPVDFRDAAERHWEDAGHLLAETRLANADHLFGLSAECALKAVMLSMGMTLRPDGAPADRMHRVHINHLWNEFITFAHQRSGVHYISHLSGVLNPFANWDVNQRYDNRTGVTPVIAADHQQAAQMAKQVLDNAILNGDII